MNSVNRVRLIDVFLTLVRILSPSSHEEEFAIFLIQKLEKMGLVVVRDMYGNIVAKLNGLGKPMVLCAHLDTVEVGGNSISVVSRDGMITSDGTTILGADNKDSIAAIIEALTVIIENNIPHRSVEVVLTREEELISRGAKNLDFSLIAGEECVISDISAPYGLIALSAPYNYKFNIVVHGKRSHVKEPENGVNVLKILARAIEVENMPLGRVGEVTTVNIAYQYLGLEGVINRGGISPAELGLLGRNTIPDLCVVHGEVRSLDGSALSNVLVAIEQAFKVATSHFGGSMEFDHEKLADGYLYHQDDPLVARVRTIFQQQGVEPQFFHSIGGSDANFLIEHGLKSLVISSAHRDNHQKSEYVVVDELVLLADFYLRLLVCS